jgi:phage terminase small subunit
MPALSNPKHEWFAQGLAKGKSADQAYEDAGYRPDRAHASRLAAKGNVQARVAEIIDRAAIKTEVTLASLLTELDEARELAMRTEQTSAAVAAIREKAVLVGLRVEKSERTNKNDPRQLTDTELSEELAQIRAALGRGRRETERPALTH